VSIDLAVMDAPFCGRAGPAGGRVFPFVGLFLVWVASSSRGVFVLDQVPLHSFELVL